MFAAALASLLATSAAAQGIQIGAPVDGSSVQAGQSLVVEVDRPDTLTGSQEVAIVIAINNCDSTCRSPSDVLGHILYTGPYNPQFQSGSGGKPPYQNFTVDLPSSLTQGKAILSVTHLSLVGAGPFPLFQIVNSTVNVA